MAKKQEFLNRAAKISTAKLKKVEGKKLNLKPLLGRWRNCDKKTRGLVMIDLGSKGGKLAVHPFGACVPNPCDWGTVKGVAYSESVSSVAAVAFTAVFKFSFSVVIVTGHLCEGCLLVETYTRFTDGSGRCDYYSRDCFYRR